MTDKEFYRSLGFCPYCRKEKLFDDEKMCPECLAKWSAYNIKNYSNVGRTNKEEHNRQRRISYEEKNKKGICVSCGKRKAQIGKKRCYLCLEKNRISSMLRREKLNGNKDC